MGSALRRRPGWDRRYDVGPGGHATGPYEPWQVLGLVAGLALLAGLAGRAAEPAVGASAITVVMTLCFVLDAVTDTQPYGASLWPIGAALVGGATAVGASAVASVVARLRRPGHGQ